MREVHAKYPQIDPESDQFNETMWVAVRNEIIGQWSETGVEDPMAAADKWYKILYGKKDKEDVEEKKAQINATISQAPRSPTTKDHSQKLRTGTLQDQAEVLEEMGY
ncbi:MAG: hypothetical protein KatS3mg101_0950 [Patescibacteria group bacterium]|nr:MAG: hypothetical protein KatS3mg101_0950 [Patescibacteria group bacterium]